MKQLLAALAALLVAAPLAAQDQAPPTFRTGVDVITVDAWYATGPFIKAVQRLGWGVVAVLKQKHYEIYGEATRLSPQLPTQAHEWKGRRVMLQEVKDLPFTDEQIGPMRVVMAEESWKENQQS